MNPRFLEQSDVARHPVDLNANFNDTRLGLPPIGTDEPLVREYLLRLFVAEPAWEPWAQMLRDTYVKPLFAEAKITAVLAIRKSGHRCSRPRRTRR
jgi:hypothetical protein